MNLPKGLASKIAATGFMSPKGMSAPNRMGGQSGYNAPRPPMGMQPKLDALKAQAVKGMPTSMFYRPATSQNKARGTMSSANRAAMGGI